MTTSYSKNIHLSNLFVYYTLDSQALLSSSMSIKTGLFSFWLSVVSLFLWYYRSLCTVLWKIYKKIGRNYEQIKNNTQYIEQENASAEESLFW